MAVILSLLMLPAGCETGSGGEDKQPAESNGKVMILYTSDMHCAVDKGFGLAGLKAVRDKLEADGYE